MEKFGLLFGTYFEVSAVADKVEMIGEHTCPKKFDWNMQAMHYVLQK